MSPTDFRFVRLLRIKLRLLTNFLFSRPTRLSKICAPRQTIRFGEGLPEYPASKAVSEQPDRLSWNNSTDKPGHIRKTWGSERTSSEGGYCYSPHSILPSSRVPDSYSLCKWSAKLSFGTADDPSTLPRRPSFRNPLCADDRLPRGLKVA